MLSLFASSIAQVLGLGLVIGAGLPALFAVGMRALAYGHGEGPDGAHHPAGTAVSALCFGLVLCAIALGILIIVSSGFGYAVSFEHIVPTLVEK